MGAFLDAASSFLGGSAAKAPEAPEPVGMMFVAAGPIDAGEVKGGAVAPGEDGPMPQEQPASIEFIHFGQVFADMAPNFEHPSKDDTAIENLAAGVPPHALMFRAALQREALLLDGFAKASQSVLQKAKDEQGAAGIAAGAVAAGLGALGVGGGGGGDDKPNPAVFDPVIAKIGEAGGKANNTPITYPDLHQAGLDLNKARYSYRAARDAIKAPSGGPADLMGMATSVLPAAVKRYTDIGTKSGAVFIGAYTKLAAAAEPAIEDACCALSVEAIRARRTPLFSIWFPAGKPPELPKPEAGSGNDPAAWAANQVNKGIAAVTEQVNKYTNAAKEFLGGAPSKAPGAAALGTAMGAIEGGTGALHDAFLSALGVSSLPGICDTLVKEIAAADAGFIKITYGRLLEHGAPEIDQDLMLEAGRQYITRRLVDVVLGLIPVVGSMKDFSAMGIGVGQHATSLLAGKLNDIAGAPLANIVELAVRDLHGTLNQARQDALGNESLTMEVFLARAPLLLASMFRNTFFPLWKLITDALFGSITGAAGGVVGQGQGAVSDVTSTIDSARDYRDKATNAAGKAGEFLGQNHTIGAGDVIAAAKDPGGALDKLMGGGGGGGEKKGGPFPGAARKKSGDGQKITKADIDGTKRPEPLQEN